MAVDPGDISCTTGLSGDIFNYWVDGDEFPGSGLSSPMTPAQSLMLRSQVTAFAQKVADAINGASSVSWIYPTLSGTWTNFGSGYCPFRYRKDASGMVFVQATVTGGTANSTIITLPVGYRPDFAMQGAAYVDVGGGTGGFGRWDLQTDGQLKCGSTSGWQVMNFSFYAG
jgi:hypothetical protein